MPGQGGALNGLWWNAKGDRNRAHESPQRDEGPNHRHHWQRTPLLQCNRSRAPKAIVTCFLLITASILAEPRRRFLAIRRGQAGSDGAGVSCRLC